MQSKMGSNFKSILAMGCDLRVLCVHKLLLQCFPLSEVEQKSKDWICHFTLSSNFSNTEPHLQDGPTHHHHPHQIPHFTVRIQPEARIQLSETWKAFFCLHTQQNLFVIIEVSNPCIVLSIPIKWKDFSIGTVHFQWAEDHVQGDLYCAFPLGGK